MLFHINAQKKRGTVDEYLHFIKVIEEDYIPGFKEWHNAKSGNKLTPTFKPRKMTAQNLAKTKKIDAVVRHPTTAWYPLNEQGQKRYIALPHALETLEIWLKQARKRLERVPPSERGKEAPCAFRECAFSEEADVRMKSHEEHRNLNPVMNLFESAYKVEFPGTSFKIEVLRCP